MTVPVGLRTKPCVFTVIIMYDIYHTQHQAVSTYLQGQDTMLCLFVAGKHCRKENSATRIVPGSHL